MRRPIRFLILLAASAGLLAGCSTPRSAGEAGPILRGAEATDATFAVMPVTRETLPGIAAWPAGRSSGVEGWIRRSRGPAGNQIEPGDTIDVSIWDNEESSLLTQPNQKVVALPDMTVSPQGTVFLPYVDEVYVARMTPDRARAAVQDRMRTIIPSAQVQLRLRSGRGSAVDLVSGVRQPGNYVMPDRDFTIMGLLAMGGGPVEQFENPQVRLSRDGRLYGVPLATLMDNPDLDTTLRGGDKVYIEDDDRYFLALGAATRQAPVPFPAERVTALDAVSLTGGLNAQRADPKGVLVLRDYDADAVRTDGTGPAKDRMIFAIDLTTADGLFSAGEFEIHDRDLVLVTESPLTSTRAILGLVSDTALARTRLQL